MALNDPRHSLLSISLAKVVVLRRLDELPPTPHSSIMLFLDGSFIACHPPLPAGREFAGVWLGEGERGKLKESCVHIADSDSVVLCYAWGTLPKEENSFHGSSLDHLLPAAVKATSGHVRFPCWGWRLLSTFPQYLPRLVED